MKKIFISQPMGGKSKEQIKVEREEIITKAKALFNEDVEIIESHFVNYNPSGGCRAMKFLAKSIELLADSDVVYFADGWQYARGCKIEHDCAVEYGMICIYE